MFQKPPNKTPAAASTFPPVIFRALITSVLPNPKLINWLMTLSGYGEDLEAAGMLPVEEEDEEEEVEGVVVLVELPCSP